jgi:hypothetical protein
MNTFYNAKAMNTFFVLLTIWSLLGLRIVRQPLRFENFWKSPMKKQVKLKTLY